MLFQLYCNFEISVDMAGAPDMFRSNLQSLVRCASAVTSDLLCCFMVTVRNNCPRNTVPGSTVKSFSIHASKVYLNQVFRLVFLTSCVEDMPHNVLKFSFITEIYYSGAETRRLEREYQTLR